MNLFPSFASIGANIFCYKTLMLAYARKADVKGAESCFSRMVLSKLQSDSHTFQTLLRTCAPAGNRNKAESWSCTMVAEGLQPNEHVWRTLVDAVGCKSCEALKTSLMIGVESDIHISQSANRRERRKPK